MGEKILLSSVHIQNYKSIKEVSLPLGPFTILLGPNNSGKTSILEAINLGLTSSVVDEEDFHQDCKGGPADKIIIDLIFEPGGDALVFSDEWCVFSQSVQNSGSGDKEWFGIRTIINWDEEQEKYVNNKRFLLTKPLNGAEPTLGAEVPKRQLNYLPVYFVNASRDLSLDIRDKRSTWYKTTSGISIGKDDKKGIEDSIKAINDKLLEKNPFLSGLAQEIEKGFNEKDGTVNVLPINRDVEQLYKGVGIYYSNQHCEQISIESLGLGTRSWAVFSVFKNVIGNRNALADRNGMPCSPILLVEEPEAHIHPQKQHTLLKEIRDVESQTVVTSHSSFILSKETLNSIVRVDMEGGSTKASPLKLEKDEIDEAGYRFLRNGGDCFFAKMLVFAEGESEMRLLPCLFEAKFGINPYQLGIQFIEMNGFGNYGTYIKIAHQLGIPYFIFSDGEKRTMDSLEKAIKKAFSQSSPIDWSAHPNIMFIPNGDDLEKYLVKTEKDAVKTALKTEFGEDFLEKEKKKKQGCKKPGGGIYDFETIDGEDTLLAAILKGNKTKYAEILARHFAAKKVFPPLVENLFSLIKTEIDK